ncbi:MAG: hypothetical protein KAS66_14175 [Candidatus Omnitrophica bacterium]|nr:hypothetical protein [Candidatus Omnitrophota bacterium]
MRKVAILIFIALIITIGFVDAQSALNLSVTPLSGGNSLRFGRISSVIEVNKEVRIRISSTDGKQYQVFHRLADPLINEKNVPLGSHVISTYTLLGSNASGTLYAQNLEKIGFADQLLYSSGTGGQSDSFTVAYAINGDCLKATGNFFGRIQYTARPIGGTSQDDVILNVTAEVSGDLRVEVEGSSTPDAVRLKLKSDRDKEGFVRLSFRENLGGEIRVFQEAELFPQDELFSEIDNDLIMVTVSGSKKGELFPSTPTALTRKRILIYSSQESEDVFYVNFILNEGAIDRQQVGIYKGRLRYTVETGDSQQEIAGIDLEVEVEPIFAIEVDLPSGGLSFERLLPDSQPILREVDVHVKTNLGRPYMVMQNIASPLTNETGNVMPDEYFTMKMDLLDSQSGKVMYSDYQSVSRSDHPIFTSDNKGSPSRFKVVYRLRPFSGMVAGGYSTAIRFSLGEI